jgi:hypothetical protein
MDVFEQQSFRRAVIIGGIIAVVWIVWSHPASLREPTSQVAMPQIVDD